jgi:prepilin-type N-terminal cleavage/methylation domain-containing protein
MFIKKYLKIKPLFYSENRRLSSVNNERDTRSQKGFTLIEIIAVLLIVGILAALGGMAIVSAVSGYTRVKENSATTQKAQMAMSRITREIIEMVRIPSDATQTVLPITNTAGDRTIGFDSAANAVKIAVNSYDPATGDILIDHVSALTFTYYTGSTSFTTWPAANDIALLSAVDISMTLNLPDRGGTVPLTLTTRISPRNNGNLGGTSPTVSPPPTVSYPGCFVATAAYGNPAHPMVQILRDFRDRYLLSFQAGRWFVKQYYLHGPAAADLIRNRPIAMWAVRCLLAPFVALVFCFMYAPLAIPFILIVSLIATGAVFSAFRGGLPFHTGVFRERGSILIGLIITMVIMAALAAAMLPLFSASSMNQVYADQGRKAYFLAESGYRYAGSLFLNATNKDAALTEINNKTCNLSDNQGAFKTIVYPLWFKTQAAGAGATSLSTTVYGTIPSEFAGTSSSGYILIDYPNDSTYYSYSGFSVSGNTLTFNLSSPLAAGKAAGLYVQTGAYPTGTSVSKGGTLTLSNTTGVYGVFPLLNGNFILKGEKYNYTKRSGTILYNITKADRNKNAAAWTTTFAATDKLILDRFLRLSSTGTIGSASREVIYNVPIGWLGDNGGFRKAHFEDQFNNDTNWFSAQGGNAQMGTHTVSGGAMNVTSVVDPTTTGSWFLNWLLGLAGWGHDGLWAINFFNWSNTDTKLEQSWQDSGGCLSYDVQVKVKNTQPYWMAGLGFRFRPNSNNTDMYTYGLSFIRQRQTSDCFLWICGAFANNDDINPALRPFTSYPSSEFISGSAFAGTQARYSDPGIILWQRNGAATGASGSFKILAYHTIVAADNLTTGTGADLRLKDWSSLMVRLIEGYELPFTSGMVDTDGRHLKYGDIVTNGGTKKWRIIGTPIMTAAWGAAGTNSAAGTLILNPVVNDDGTISAPFSSGENIYIDDGISGVIYAQASGTQAATKANYIMVYYSDNKSPVAGDTVQANNTRIGNVRDGAIFLAGHLWPPDDQTDTTAGLPTDSPAGNDFFTLMQWDSNFGTNIAPSLTQGDWTMGAGWHTPIYGGVLIKDGNSSGTAQPSPALAITAGVTYDVSVSVSNWGGTGAGRSFSYTLGGVPVRTVTANGTYTDVITATATGNLIFTATPPSRFRITDVSIIPRLYVNTTPDSQGNVASFVPALNTSDFYNTVIRTAALTSPVWTSPTSTFSTPGDYVALITSSSAGTYTSYDDFGIQMDIKFGTGFLSPIQQ